MRFSAIFQVSAVPTRSVAPARDPAQAEPTPAPAAAVPAAADSMAVPAELPDDLDARVRLVGEWQLGEGY